MTKDELDHCGPRWSPDWAALSTTRRERNRRPRHDLGSPGSREDRHGDSSAHSDQAISVMTTSLAFFRFNGEALELATAARDGSNARSVTTLTVGESST